jgi:hypothetical protein
MRPDKFLNETRVAVVTVSACVLAGCVIVRPANSSKSFFADSQSAGETVNVSPGSPGNEAFRVYHQGASPYESPEHVRKETHLRAKEYCDRKGEVPESITETTSIPPYSLDNLPRMEIVFDCVAKAAVAVSPPTAVPAPPAAATGATAPVAAAAPAASEPPKPVRPPSSASDEPKYSRLVNLKKLLDSGILTQEEFNREKAKILNEP